MTHNDPPLLIFMRLCNPLSVSVGWTNWFTFYKQTITEGKHSKGSQLPHQWAWEQIFQSLTNTMCVSLEAEPHPGEPWEIPAVLAVPWWQSPGICRARTIQQSHYQTPEPQKQKDNEPLHFPITKIYSNLFHSSKKLVFLSLNLSYSWMSWGMSLSCFSPSVSS